MNFRKDIELYRAFAVLVVVFYHCHFVVFNNFQLLQGGFLGVDIFFVISGFLITSILYSEQQKNTYNYFNFISKRFKRIVPVFIFILLLTSIATYFILLPEEMQKYDESLITSLFFVSNILYMNQDSYVDISSNFKPLLHTWSLSVEIQFYILYPIIFIFILQKLTVKKINVIFISLVCLSLLISFYLKESHPDFVFFSIPTRLYEFLIGALFALNLISINSVFQNKYIRFLIKIISLIIIVLSVFYIDDKNIYQPFISLPLVVATALILSIPTNKFALENNFITLIFGYIGLISFEIYLWHQPIFVFYRLYFGENSINIWIFAVLFALIVLLSSAIYHLIEKQYRVNKLSINKKLSLFFLFTILVAYGWYGFASSGIQERFTTQEMKIYNNYSVEEFRRLKDKNESSGIERVCGMRSPQDACRFGDQSFVVVGDSFAGMYEYALEDQLRSFGHGLISFSFEQCPFVDDTLWFGTVKSCPKINKQRWEEIYKFKDRKTFIISADFNQFFATKQKVIENQKTLQQDELNKLAWSSFAANVQQLLALGHRVIVLYQPPDPIIDVKKDIYRSIRTNTSIQTIYSGNNIASQKINLELDKILPDNPNLVKIKPYSILCKNENECLSIIENYGGLYNLGNHLSYFGAKLILDETLFNKEFKGYNLISNTAQK